MSREPLRTPLGGLFEQHLPEETVHRLWLRIGQGTGTRPRVRLTAALVVAAALACVAIVAKLHVSSQPEALRLANLEKVPAVLTARLPGVVAFDDGSSVELGRETQLDVLQSTERAFVLALRSGQARFSVVPGGPRAWQVECGPVSVEVVGTRFLVERGSVSVRVEVEHGRVLVRGEGVPDRVARLGATDSLVVPLFPAAAPAAAQAVSAMAAAGAAPPASLTARLIAREEEVPRARPIPSERPSDVPEPAPDAVDTLLHQADVARREGSYARAASLLERIAADHPADGRAALAHFTLGRLYLDSLGEPGRATEHFTRAIQRGVPGALAEDAHARLVQARARAGDRAGAESAAARYRALYPAGRHLDEVKRWVAAGTGP